MSPTEVLLLLIIFAIGMLWVVLLGIEKAYNKMVTKLNDQSELLKMLAEHQVSFAKEVRLRQALEPEMSKPSKYPPYLKCLDPNYDPGTEINK